MTVADGFFFGVGFWGSFLAFMLFLLLVTLITMFCSYILDKGKKERGTGRDDRNGGGDVGQG